MLNMSLSSASTEFDFVLLTSHFLKKNMVFGPFIVNDMLDRINFNLFECIGFCARF